MTCGVAIVAAPLPSGVLRAMYSVSILIESVDSSNQTMGINEQLHIAVSMAIETMSK